MRVVTARALLHARLVLNCQAVVVPAQGAVRRVRIPGMETTLPLLVRVLVPHVPQPATALMANIAHVVEAQ